MRKISPFAILISIFLLSTVLSIHAEEDLTIVREITYEEFDNKVRINIDTTKPVEVVYYDISDPPQIILNPIGDIFSNLPEVKSILKGGVKEIRAIKKLEEKPESLDESYYRIDFFIIELEELKTYHLFQDGNLTILDIESEKKEYEFSSSPELLSLPTIPRPQVQIPPIPPTIPRPQIPSVPLPPVIPKAYVPTLPKPPVVPTRPQISEPPSIPTLPKFEPQLPSPPEPRAEEIEKIEK